MKVLWALLALQLLLVVIPMIKALTRSDHTAHTKSHR